MLDESETKQNPTPDFFKSTKIMAGILVLAVLAGLGLFYWYSQKKHGSGEKDSDKGSKVTTTLSRFYDPALGTPPDFPIGLPLDKPFDFVDNSTREVTVTSPTKPSYEVEGEIDSNATALGVAPQGVLSNKTPAKDQSQDNSQTFEQKVLLVSTVEYITGASLEDSKRDHRNYFSNAGWNIEFDGGQGELYTIRGTKLQTSLVYTYFHDSAAGKNYIKLIYTTPKPTEAEEKFIKDLQKQINVP